MQLLQGISRDAICGETRHLHRLGQARADQPRTSREGESRKRALETIWGDSRSLTSKSDAFVIRRRRPGHSRGDGDIACLIQKLGM